MNRVENTGGLFHEFDEKFNVWICRFCGNKKEVLNQATRKSRGIKPPRDFIINQYAPVISNIPIDQDHIRFKKLVSILETHFSGRDTTEIMEDMLYEGIIQVDYSMKNAKKSFFKPMRIRLNPAFEDKIRKSLDELEGIESLDYKKINVIKILANVNFKSSNNFQTQVILKVLEKQKEILSNDELPYFVCGYKKCWLKNNNNRYEQLLSILFALLDNVKNENLIVSSDFCSSIDLSRNCLSEYRSDLEMILGSKLVFFGILRNVEPLYISPSKIPIEVHVIIEVFEINLRNFIKNRLSNNYEFLDVVIFDLFKEIFVGNGWKKINNSMIKDLKSDVEKNGDPEIKKALDIALNSQSYNQFLFDRFFEAMVFDNLITIINHEWDVIFSKHFGTLTKDDVFAKLKAIKGDRNIKSHPKSRIPTTFMTLTCILEFSQYILNVDDLIHS